MKTRMVVVPFILMILLVAFGCAPPEEEPIDVEGPYAPAETEEDVVEAELPDEFPVYPGADFRDYYTRHGVNVYQYVITDPLDIVSTTYRNILEEEGFDTRVESTDRFTQIQIMREGMDYAQIAGEEIGEETHIEIMVFPQE